MLCDLTECRCIGSGICPEAALVGRYAHTILWCCVFPCKVNDAHARSMLKMKLRWELGDLRMGRRQKSIHLEIQGHAQTLEKGDHLLRGRARGAESFKFLLLLVRMQGERSFHRPLSGYSCSL